MPAGTFREPGPGRQPPGLLNRSGHGPAPGDSQAQLSFARSAERMQIKRRVAAGAAGVVLLAGGGGAYAVAQAASKPGPKQERSAYLNDLAKRLGVSRDKLDESLKSAATARVDTAVAPGRLTKAQGDELKARIAKGDGPLGLGRGRGGHRWREHGGRGGPGFGPGGRERGAVRAGLGAAATYLGLSRPALRTELRAGKSLADVANAKGKSADGLKQAIVDAVTARLDAAVKAGRLTDTRRNEIVRNLPAEVVEHIAAAPGRRHGPRGGGLGPRRP